MANKTQCHCGGSKSYEFCCQPLHYGEKAATTAVQLMRSRYSAFVVRDVNYLLATQHPNTRPQRSEIVAGMVGCDWLGLKIVSLKGGKARDLFGEVSFVAQYTENGVSGEIRERSQFVFEADRWLYMTGAAL